MVLSPIRFVLTAFIAVAALGCTTPALAAPPDANLFNNYYLGSGYQTLNYIVCGSTRESEGCYASGTLGPFGRVGAMIEGTPETIGHTVTRAIYVVDIGTGPDANGVTLYRYLQTDQVTASTDTTTVKLTNTVPLPLIGGAKALCSMAANAGFIFIGTDQSPSAVRVQKGSFNIAQVGGIGGYETLTVSSITANSYGFVTVTFGGFLLNGANGFYVFGPDGEGVEDGGGPNFMLTSIVGLSTTTLPTSDALPSSRLRVKPRTLEQ